MKTPVTSKEFTGAFTLTKEFPRPSGEAVLSPMEILQQEQKRMSDLATGISGGVSKLQEETPNVDLSLEIQRVKELKQELQLLNRYTQKALNKGGNEAPISPETNLTLLQEAQNAIREGLEYLNQPDTYKSVEEALVANGLQERGVIGYDELGMPFVADPQTGEKQRNLYGLGLALLMEGKQLSGFKGELRIKDGKPVVVAGFDLTDRYRIVTGVTDAVDRTGRNLVAEGWEGIQASRGRTECLLVEDKTDRTVTDLRGVIPESYDTFTVADTHDFKAERLSRAQGSTTADRLIFRLITTPEAFGSFLHEVGHANLRQFLVNLLGPEKTEQFNSLLSSARTNIGNFPEPDTQAAMRLDEATASEIGLKISSLIKDENLRSQIDSRLNQISARHTTVK